MNVMHILLVALEVVGAVVGIAVLLVILACSALANSKGNPFQ